MNLARLNHIFVPQSRSERERWRKGIVGKLLYPFLWLYIALSEEGRFLLVAAIVTGFAGMNVYFTDNYLLWSALISPIVISLIVRLAYSQPQIELQLNAPQRVSLGQIATLHLTLLNTAKTPQSRLRIMRPMLPWDGKWTQARPEVLDLPTGEQCILPLAVKFSMRGSHTLDPFFVAQQLPLGLAQSKALQVLAPTIIIVPRIANVTAIDLPLAGRYQQGGVALASKAGESAELLGIRPYRRGDSVRDLHSRSWARFGEPIVREYQQEYFSRVAVILDSDFGKQDSPELEALLSLCAGVISRLTHDDVLIDLLVPSKNFQHITIGRGLGGIDQVLDCLAHIDGRDAFDGAALQAKLRHSRTRYSCFLFLGHRWQEQQIATKRQFETQGTPHKIFLVQHSAADHDQYRSIPTQQISTGQQIQL